MSAKAVLIIIFAAVMARPATAQRLGLPVDVPSLPVVKQLPGVIERTQDRITRLADRRLGQVNELLERHPDVLEASPSGGVMVRHQVIAFAPTAQALEAALAQGFTIVSREAVDGLEAELVVLSVPKGQSTRKALDRLRKIDPEGAYDFNDIYLESQSAATTGADHAAMRGAGGGRVGLIDGGVDAGHPAFRGARIIQKPFSGKIAPSEHGTQTASLLVARADGFSGAAAGAELMVADVYGGAPTGGSTGAIIQALGWMARERTGVINISLVGPANKPLGLVVAELNRRGHLIVAAVGNDGPAAKPLYPAAYPGVVAVTAVDKRNRVLIEAGRGPHVALAAPGADMAAAIPGGKYISVRGTSYAAPIVAGLLAQSLTAPDPQRARSSLNALEAKGVDLGAKGVDPIYGAGLVGEEFRFDLQRITKNLKK